MSLCLSTRGQRLSSLAALGTIPLIDLVRVRVRVTGLDVHG